jgi:hypothetical protein
VCGVGGSAGGQLGGAGLADSVRGDVVACRRVGRGWGGVARAGQDRGGAARILHQSLALVGLASPSYSDIHGERICIFYIKFYSLCLS